MGTIREFLKKDGKVSFHAEVRLKGFPKKRWTHRTRTKAKEWIQSLEAEMRDGRYKKRVNTQKRTVGELIDRYIKEKLSNYPERYHKTAAHFAWWKKETGHLLLSDFKVPLINACKDKLLNEETCRHKLRNPATVNRYLASISKALSVALKEWEWLEENPMHKIEKEKETHGRERFLSREEKKKQLATCKQANHSYLYPIVAIALTTGMRKGEILGLRWKDIDFEMKKIILQKTKNGDRRVIPLIPQLEEILDSLHSDSFSAEQYIFSVKDIRHAFKKVLEVAGIEGFVFHDLRHTAASYLAMDGATQGELMEILGHRSPHMTRRYAHYSQKHIKNILEKSGGKLLHAKISKIII